MQRGRMACFWALVSLMSRAVCRELLHYLNHGPILQHGLDTERQVSAASLTTIGELKSEQSVLDAGPVPSNHRPFQDVRVIDITLGNASTDLRV